jgi:hypothetical protein
MKSPDRFRFPPGPELDFVIVEEVDVAVAHAQQGMRVAGCARVFAQARFSNGKPLK